MAASKPFILAGVLLAGAALSACTSTAENSAASLSMTSVAAYPMLPEAINIVPAVTDGDDMPAGSIAEATVLVPAIAVAAVETDAGDVSAAGDVTEAGVAAAAVAAAPETPELPATVQLASATPQDAALPGVVPASYSGPTPNSPLAASVFDDSPPAAAQRPTVHAPEGRMGPDTVGARSPELDQLMAQYAQHYDVPEELVRNVARRESTFNPKARNGPYWGLMQIRHDTARGMGYRGDATGLLDAETNLKYAVRYLRGAWLVAKGNIGLADRLYQRGYYYDAKRAGLLDETGLGKDRRRRMPQS
ncbi:lytic transglycosylase domain-containing protein [Arvimicrobium flavum]|uniref:lytic transglycosylase domain-containing protein n=1 Tax=Arvimicrobium flavum TaxID=3393320 RepID=UPI00237B7D80|nr:lytic transglycosylase domain-containing protein [Mesorhizobium shangrilense]